MSSLAEFSLPWLFLLGFLLPVALMIPLLVEHKRSRDVGPRVVPATTLAKRTKARTAQGRKAKDPEPTPGLTRVPVDLEVLEDTELEGNVVTDGTLVLAPRAVLRGSGKARAGVRIGEAATVHGNVITAGDVDLGRLSHVQGLVYTTGSVTLRPGAVVKGIYAQGRVDVYPGAEIVEDVLAEQGVHLVVPVEKEKALEELESLNALLNPEAYMEEEE